MAESLNRVVRAMHRADVEIGDRPGPFILSLCVGVDGRVQAVLTDGNGQTVARTRAITP